MAHRTEQNNPLSEAVALLVLDIQNAFLPVIHESNTFLNRCAFAIEAARIFRIRTIFTEQVPDKLGKSHPHLIRLADKPKVFHKTAFSALQIDELEEYLKTHGIYHLLIIGLEVPVCVYQTVLQAIDHEIDVTLLSDCLGLRRPQDNSPVLASLAQMGCHILPSESVFYSLLGDAKNPLFRPYTELVKKYATNTDLENNEPLSSSPQKKDLKKTENTKGKKQKKLSQKSSSKSAQSAAKHKKTDAKTKANQSTRRKTSKTSESGTDQAHKTKKAKVGNRTVRKTKTKAKSHSNTRKRLSEKT